MTSICVLGGGVHVATFFNELARSKIRQKLDLRLFGRRRERAQNIAQHCAAQILKNRPNWRIRSTDNISEAVNEADIIIIMVRIGGSKARQYDEQFPREFGLVGDEGLSVGGLANAWRTIPELESIIEKISTHAPKAQILNLVAPLGITTRLFLERDLRAIGVCELPFVTLNKLRAGKELKFDYCGLNHLGWFWGEILQTANISGLVDNHVLEQFKALPLHYYYRVFDTAAGDRLGIRAPDQRTKYLKGLSDEIYDKIVRYPGEELTELSMRATPWFEHALVPICEALIEDLPHIAFTNVSNKGQLPFLPQDLVVELPARISCAQVETKPPHDIPSKVQKFLSRLGEVENLAYSASLTRDTRLMTKAIATLPFELTNARVKRLADLATISIADIRT